MLIIFLMSVYASIKFDLLVNRSNPNISKTEELAAIGESDILNLEQAGLKFAFTAYNFDKVPMNDPRFVRFIVMSTGSVGGEFRERPVEFHECSEAELEGLATPTSEA